MRETMRTLPRGQNALKNLELNDLCRPLIGDLDALHDPIPTVAQLVHARAADPSDTDFVLVVRHEVQHVDLVRFPPAQRAVRIRPRDSRRVEAVSGIADPVLAVRLDALQSIVPLVDFATEHDSSRLQIGFSASVLS